MIDSYLKKAFSTVPCRWEPGSFFHCRRPTFFPLLTVEFAQSIFAPTSMPLPTSPVARGAGSMARKGELRALCEELAPGTGDRFFESP
jgi:hypothetical protein